MTSRSAKSKCSHMSWDLKRWRLNSDRRPEPLARWRGLIALAADGLRFANSSARRGRMAHCERPQTLAVSRIAKRNAEHGFYAVVAHPLAFTIEADRKGRHRLLCVLEGDFRWPCNAEQPRGKQDGLAGSRRLIVGGVEDPAFAAREGEVHRLVDDLGEIGYVDAVEHLSGL